MPQRDPGAELGDGIQCLADVVETDRGAFTASAVWRFAREGAVTFDAGEPICLLQPVQRGVLEQFEPEVRDIREEPELTREYLAWLRARLKLYEIDPPTEPKQFSRDYMRGAEQHRLHRREFRRAGEAA